jgi:hypothetical protein
MKHVFEKPISHTVEHVQSHPDQQHDHGDIVCFTGGIRPLSQEQKI